MNVIRIIYNSVIISFKANGDEKECIAHKLEYLESNDDKKCNDEKFDWKIMKMQSNNKCIEFTIKSSNKSTNYLIHANSTK